MKLSRALALKIHLIFDQFIPPFLRDSRWFMGVFLRIAFRHRASIYLDFKKNVYQLTEEEFREVYLLTSEVAFERKTDLNQVSIDKIMAHIRGDRILEVGCGRGYLAGLISNDFSITAVDIIIQPGLRERYPKVSFREANIESLPFLKHEFDTVICTHTLEHVRNLHQAVAELRRVGKRLIIVVPRQRPYIYTFDLHLNFFPYHYCLQSVMGKTRHNVICEDAGGDIFYVEDTE